MTKSVFEIDIEDRASAPLHQILTAVTKPKPVFEAIGADLEAEVQLGFVNGQDPYGNAWKHPVYRDGDPLRDTGRLMNSITHVANNAGVEVGTNVVYAAIHQFGGEIQHAARTQELFFRQNLRTGEVGTKFVKKSKSNFAQKVSIGAHATTIPPRPFLPNAKGGLPEHWWTAIESRFAKAMGVTK